MHEGASRANFWSPPPPFTEGDPNGIAPISTRRFPTTTTTNEPRELVRSERTNPYARARARGVDCPEALDLPAPDPWRCHPVKCEHRGYTGAMSDVVATDEAGASLGRIADRFAAGDDEPVYFGAHGRPQGVIVPVDVWERFLEAAEDELDLALVAERIASDDGRRYTQSEMDAYFDKLAANE